ncbi:unnamed protein product [Ectocarpus sp. CCAP 1310/34]|nr:unnamed protein product [Ectocarpus sp. CCAP 1310/34]
MVLDLEVTNRASALPVELTNDLMDSFGIFCATYGGTPLGQQSQKALQCFPIAWACLAVKEAEKKSKEVRDRDVSRCYQEIALPGRITLCHRAIASPQSPTTRCASRPGGRLRSRLLHHARRCVTRVKSG